MTSSAKHVASPLPTQVPLHGTEFKKIQDFIFAAAGITLSQGKQALVTSRLARRLEHYGLRSYGEYVELLCGGKAPEEVQHAVDLLTTNETYFFREAKHLDWLAALAQEVKSRRQMLRVWSAACSTGEETYSIAMVLSDTLQGGPWQLLGSDINATVLERARRGHYRMVRTEGIPQHYLKRFCLRGVGPEAGNLLIERSLRARVEFAQINLDRPLPPIGPFDVVFLRNVMIYFNQATKQEVVARIRSRLRQGGHLVVGISESLNGIDKGFELVAPGIYRHTGPA